MADVHVSTCAQTDLDGIWLYIARESGSIEIASRVVDTITDRFWSLGQHPEIGRRRDDDYVQACAAFQQVNTSSSIASKVKRW
jgi:plasmid stabilization system protein ParE